MVGSLYSFTGWDTSAMVWLIQCIWCWMHCIFIGEEWKWIDLRLLMWSTIEFEIKYGVWTEPYTQNCIDFIDNWPFQANAGANSNFMQCFNTESKANYTISINAGANSVFTLCFQMMWHRVKLLFAPASARNGQLSVKSIIMQQL